MYRYDAIDQRLVDERVAQFRDQTDRFLAGQLGEDEFKQLRLRNGLYIQRHAPMLRVAIPYGLLNTGQLRTLASIAREFDRGYGHFTTRQNIQFNWPKLEQVPDILARLATVQLHAIQTSGNCIRNVTADHLAGVAPDEVVDPLVWCELIRQWSTFHPEFSYLPRKFKIALSGSQSDRAAVRVHDIGLEALRDGQGDVGFRVWVGGGLGRAPAIGVALREFLPWQHLLSYLEAIMRLYNRFGRRDNIHKARIKFLVKELGAAAFATQVEAEWAQLRDGPATLNEEKVQRIATRFTQPAYDIHPEDAGAFSIQRATDPSFAGWTRRNVHSHKVSGYAAVTLSLKRVGVPPGDLTADDMDAVATLADRYSFGALRVTHEQNLLFADVRQRDLYPLWLALCGLRLASANIGLLGNVIACPGGDFCSLANARSIPIAQAIIERFDDLDFQFDIGELDLNISGCMNACAHHHVGHIGVLGVDKNGEEFYQIEIGGSQGVHASLGKVVGPAFGAGEVPEIIARLLACYLDHRDGDEERFIDVVRRIGVAPFKEYVYDHPDSRSRDRALRPLALA